MSIRKITILAVLTFVLLGCSVSNQPLNNNTESNNQPTSDYQTKTVVINNNDLKVEVADTMAKKIKGLSGRESMPQDQGMLFVFDEEEVQQFWMKDMKFPLDFIWLAKGQVVDLHENIKQPKSSLETPVTVTPKNPIDAVIEVNSGWIKSHNIKIGDTVFGL